MAGGILDLIAPWEAADTARQQTIAQWMRGNIYFGPDRPRPGRFVPDAWQEPILDSMMNSRETVLKIRTQAGKSMMFSGVLGWLGEAGKTAMGAFPTEDLRERFFEQAIFPMLEDCPRLDAMLERTDKGQIRQDMLMRKGASPIPMATSGGKGQLQQWTAEYTLADEVDKFQLLGESNDPLEILRERGRAYGEKARLIVASTPTTRDASLIEAHYLSSSQYKRYAPCPLCGDLTLLNFNAETPDRLTCQCCEEMLPFDAQDEMLAAGQWIPDKPGMVGQIDGYHLNAFWDARTPWQAVLRRYNPERPRDFFVQLMAIAASNLAEDPLEEAEVEALFQPVPPGWPQVAKVITVDVQRRRSGELVYALWGIHDSMRRPALVCHWQRVITRGTREWTAAFRDLRKEYLTNRPSCMFVDAGDAAGCDVQEEIRKVFRAELRSGRVRPIKGWAPADSRQWGTFPFIKTEETIRTKDKKLNRPLEINSPSCKSRFIEMMRQQRVILPGERGVDYPSNIIDQFTAEVLRSYIGIGGMERMKWYKPPGRENEALDNGTYALATTAYLGPTYGERMEYGPTSSFVPGGV